MSLSDLRIAADGILLVDVATAAGAGVLAALPDGVATASVDTGAALIDLDRSAIERQDGWLGCLHDVDALVLAGVGPDAVVAAADAALALGVGRLVALVAVTDVQRVTDALAARDPRRSELAWSVLPAAGAAPERAVLRAVSDASGADPGAGVDPRAGGTPAAVPAAPDGPVVAFYNGGCPVCSTEINAYKRVVARHGDRVGLWFHDINADRSALAGFGLDGDAAKRRMHALDAAGRLHAGVDAFAVIWERMPGAAWAARLIRLPGVHAVAGWVYDRVLAPGLFALGKSEGRLTNWVKARLKAGRSAVRRSRVWTV